jgi:Xaa-Pro aminopeptidase
MSSPNASLTVEKVSQAVQILNELNIDLWLTFARETSMLPDPALELILGLEITWRSLFMLSRSGRHTAIVGYYDADSVRQLDVYQEVVGYHHGAKDHLLAALKKYRPARIAINYSENDVAADGLTLGNYRTLLTYLNGSPYSQRLESAESIIAALRGRKTPQEIKRMRRAIVITEDFFNEVEAFVRPGMTQRQIADFVHHRIDESDLEFAWDRAYNPIVTCGPDSPIGHAIPGDVPLERGHTLHLDLGIKYEGYCSDLQRMWYVLDAGETEAPGDVRRAFDTVLAAIRAGEGALRPGVPGWQVDAAARKVIVDADYPEYMHAFGHLLGRSAHDGAMVLAPRWEKYAGISDLPVETGNVFTLELHVFVPGRGIMSLEEDVLLTQEGVEYLSSPQSELRTIHS